MAPARIEDSGLPVARLAELLLKHLYFKSPMSAKDWAAAACLPFRTVPPALPTLAEPGRAPHIRRMAGPAPRPAFGAPPASPHPAWSHHGASTHQLP